MKSFINNYLDPAERMSEILFGLIMTLTFTLGADLVVSEGPDAVHEMIVGIIGCNIAWGIIDGLLYVFNSMYGRGAVYRVVRMLWREGPESVRDKLDEHLEETFGGALSTSTRGAVAWTCWWGARPHRACAGPTWRCRAVG